MYRRSWAVIGLVALLGVAAFSLILWRYVRLGATTSDIASWMGLVAACVTVVAAVVIVPSLGPALRNLELKRRGQVLSVVGAPGLLEALHANGLAESVSRLPAVVSVTFSGTAMTFWEGSLDPMPIASVPRDHIEAGAVEGEGTHQLLTTSLVALPIRDSSVPLPLLLLSGSFFGFGPVRRDRAMRELRRLGLTAATPTGT